MAAFKDHIDAAAIGRLADALAAVDPAFPVNTFTRSALDGLDRLELKARVAHVASALGQELPHRFDRAAQLVARAVFGGTVWQSFDLWPVQHWIMEAGIDHPDVALPLVARVTPRFSGEFAVRPFIDRDQDAMSLRLASWARDRDEHVRRLSSEGSRPRLPWGPRLRVEPAWALPVLDLLRDDDSEYVRRSVANHLNDISHLAPDLALATARRWLDEPGPHTEQLVRHALRTLVKRGHPAALALFGADHAADLAVESFEVLPVQLPIGATVTLRLVLRSAEDVAHHVVVDYSVHYVGAKGGTNTKTFKWRTLDLAPGATVELVKRHTFRDVSIRTHRLGDHHLTVHVNGRRAATATVALTSTPV